MTINIVKKMFKNRKSRQIFGKNILHILYNHKVSKPFVVRFLLDLSNYCIFNNFVKEINISILKTKNLLLISIKNLKNTNNVAYINNCKVQLYLIFDYYSHRDL